MRYTLLTITELTVGWLAFILGSLSGDPVVALLLLAAARALPFPSG